jgi:RNA polymerase sigma-70 factor (ECF subfamily)
MGTKTEQDPGVQALATKQKPVGVEGDRADAARAAGGDTAAFERLYRRHVGHIYSMARRMAGETDADDLTQEVFIRAWRKLNLFRGDSAFGTWLYRLAVNVILARRQTLGTYRARFGGPDPTTLPMAARRVTHELRIDFEEAIRKLPPGARYVFVLHDVEGYTHEEIGAMLEVTAGTSKSQLHRARMALRQHLDAREA